MGIFWRRAACAVLAAAVLFSASSAFAGHGGGCHRKNGRDRVEESQIEEDFSNYDEGSAITTDGVNTRCGNHNYGSSVSADLGEGHHFSGGFCISSDLREGHRTLVVSMDAGVISRDETWLCHNGDGCYYPVDIADDETSFEIADGSWADLDGSENGSVEAAVLFSSLSASSGAETGSSSGGGCNAAGSLFGLIALCVPLLFYKNRSL